MPIFHQLKPQVNNSVITVGMGHVQTSTYNRDNAYVDASGLNNRLTSRDGHEAKDFVLFASKVRTASENSEDQQNLLAKGLKLRLKTTTIVGGNTLDISLQYKDPATQDYIKISGASFGTQTATGSTELTVYPGVTNVGNSQVDNVIPTTWRAAAVIGGTGTPEVTFSLGGSYIY